MSRVTNPGLAALIQHAGFPSQERFAQEVNSRAWHEFGVRLCYDHVSVKRWLAGAVCQYPDVVAKVISDAWGFDIPVGALWPEARAGAGPVPIQVQPWVPERTLEQLAVFLGSDMLTRREALAQAFGVMTGASFVDPISRWLSVEPGRIDARDAPTRIGMTEVEHIEAAADHLRRADYTIGGGVMREAGAGHLKYAVDLARHSGYSANVGDRLLVAIARLAGEVGWMSHDVGMEGPAQRYLTLCLQTAGESRSVESTRFVVGALTNMARQMATLDRPAEGLKLIDLALDRLPADRRHYNSRRANLWNLKARMLAGMGPGHLPEVRSALGLSFELLGKATSTSDDVPWPESPISLYNEAEFASVAAESFGQLGEPVAADAESWALKAISGRAEIHSRSRVFDRIELARARFRTGEPDQAATDAITAADLAGTVTASHRVTHRLRSLLTDAEPFRTLPRVQEMRERLAAA